MNRYYRKKEFECPTCGKDFKKERQLRSHRRDSARCLMDMEIKKMQKRYGGADKEHPLWPRSEWKVKVQNVDTNLEYWEWVFHLRESQNKNS